MKNQISIYIGEYYASSEPTVIHTILGSCVAVCLFDPVNRIGGMNHILLPGKADLRHFDVSARYGINAMELLINKIMTIGGDRNWLVAKVFGGGHINSTISKENGMGDKNSSFVLEFLRREKIEVISKDVGGTDSRKIYFHTDTGDVLLKRFPSMDKQSLAEREESELEHIREAAYEPGGVMLFNK